MDMGVQSITAPWLWLTAGVLLCAAEALAPGMFLLWIGIAAVATGLTVFIAPLGLEWTLIAFGVYAGLASLIGRRVYGSAGGGVERPFLNRRADALIGRRFELDEPIRRGEGRIRVNDSVWRVRGPDMPAGAPVRVTGVEDGVMLRVEPA